MSFYREGYLCVGANSSYDESSMIQGLKPKDKYTNEFLVKYNDYCGYVLIQKTFILPRDFIGKRIRLKVEVVE